MRNRQALGVIAAGLSLVLVTPCAAQDEPDSINLACAGTGKSTETQTTYVSERERHGDSSFGTVTTTGKQGFSGTAYVEISGSFARVKVPNAMLPTIRGGDDGWFTVKDLFMNDREITGKIKLNALNKPKLRIDRISGVLSLSGGFSEFSGECTVQDLSKPKF